MKIRNYIITMALSLVLIGLAGCQSLSKVQDALTPKTVLIVGADHKYQNVQDAMDVARPGDTIFVKRGIYTKGFTTRPDVVMEIEPSIFLGKKKGKKDE